MSKYEPSLGDLKSRILSSESILILLPSQVTTDKLAAGLSLFLSLEQTGKTINIVSEGTVLVSHSNLYGVGKVKSTLHQRGAGNLTITLEGVVAPDGTVPSLDKLDWFPEGQNLNLVFHVLPGQKFEPKNITPKFADNSKSLIFVVSAGSLNELGSMYSVNSGLFQGAYIVNIDNNTGNTKFGTVNVVDSTPSVSEIVMALLSDLGLIINSDIASNVLAGVYSATNNMTTGVTPETFMAVGQAMQAGGQVPGQTPSAQSSEQPVPVAQPQLIQPQSVTSQSQPNIPSFSQTFAPQTPVQNAPAPSPLASNPFIPPVADSFTFSGNTAIPAASITQPVTEPAPVTGTPLNQPVPAPSMPNFTTPQSEQPVQDSQPSADWLTPKVYKGTSLG